MTIVVQSSTGVMEWLTVGPGKMKRVVKKTVRSGGMLVTEKVACSQSVSLIL